MAVDLKSTAVTQTQKQAEHYSSQITVHEEEFAEAQKALPKSRYLRQSRTGIYISGGRLTSSSRYYGRAVSFCSQTQEAIKSRAQRGRY